MDVICRPLVEDEHRAAHEISRLAFGAPRLKPEEPLPPRPGRVRWGAFDNGRLVAIAADRIQGQWYGGRLVPASGVASVAVVPGERGKGHAQVLLAALLAGARDRGAVVSTLFPSAPALYRRLGWEMTGTFTWWEFAAADLAGVRMPTGCQTRPATEADRDTILAVYEQVASGTNGYLARDNGRFPGWPFHQDDGIDGVTLAVSPDGDVTGFTTWTRGTGYFDGSRLTVSDVVATDAGGTAALLSSIGSWSAIVPTVSMLLPRPDPAWWIIPTRAATVRETKPWMTRLIDAAGAVAARGWPANVEVSVDVEVTDQVCPWNAGRFTLSVSGGQGKLIPGGEGTVTMSATGLGVLFAGGVTAHQLRAGGLLSGGGVTHDRALDAMTTGPLPATLNSF